MNVKTQKSYLPSTHKEVEISLISEVIKFHYVKAQFRPKFFSVMPVSYKAEYPIRLSPLTVLSTKQLTSKVLSHGIRFC